MSLRRPSARAARLAIVAIALLVASQKSIWALQAGVSDIDTEPLCGPDKQVRSEEARVAGAFNGTLDGRILYEKACASCHGTGFNGAPRLIASDWPNYEQIGVDPYTIMAIQGVGIMPPRGGQPNLTDDQVRRAVQYMLDQLDGF